MMPLVTPEFRAIWRCLITFLVGVFVGQIATNLALWLYSAIPLAVVIGFWLYTERLFRRFDRAMRARQPRIHR